MRDDMKVSQGPRFPVVALAGVGHMPAKGGVKEAARLFYVAETRATQWLVTGVGGDGGGRGLGETPVIVSTSLAATTLAARAS